MSWPSRANVGPAARTYRVGEGFILASSAYAVKGTSLDSTQDEWKKGNRARDTFVWPVSQWIADSEPGWKAEISSEASEPRTLRFLHIEWELGTITDLADLVAFGPFVPVLTTVDLVVAGPLLTTDADVTDYLRYLRASLPLTSRLAAERAELLDRPPAPALEAFIEALWKAPRREQPATTALRIDMTTGIVQWVEVFRRVFDETAVSEGGLSAPQSAAESLVDLREASPNLRPIHVITAQGAGRGVQGGAAGLDRSRVRIRAASEVIERQALQAMFEGLQETRRWGSVERWLVGDESLLDIDELLQSAARGPWMPGVVTVGSAAHPDERRAIESALWEVDERRAATYCIGTELLALPTSTVRLAEALGQQGLQLTLTHVWSEAEQAVVAEVAGAEGRAYGAAAGPSMESVAMHAAEDAALMFAHRLGTGSLIDDDILGSRTSPGAGRRPVWPASPGTDRVVAVLADPLAAQAGLSVAVAFGRPAARTANGLPPSMFDLVSI